MSDPKYNAPITLSTLMVVGVSILTTTPMILGGSSLAESLSITTQEPATPSSHLILPAGTQIPIRYDKAEKILLTREETLTLTLKVASDIANGDGKIVIPDGSEIIGEIKPSGKGSRFFSHSVLIKTDNQTQFQTSLNAISQVITHIETLIKGVDYEELFNEATLGQKAKKILYSFREYTQNRRSGLDSAEIEALAGWFLGAETLDLISIDPEKDLNLTLQSELILR